MILVKCSECRGACCESFTLRVGDVRVPDAADTRRWLELHAEKSSGELTFECRCTALTQDGRCGVYSTRPMVCMLYVAGGQECLATVRKRRTPAEYARIREAGDPVTIHEA